MWLKLARVHKICGNHKIVYILRNIYKGRARKKLEKKEEEMQTFNIRAIHIMHILH